MCGVVGSAGRHPADRRFHPRRGGRRGCAAEWSSAPRLFDPGAAQRRSDGRRDDLRAACVIACVDHPHGHRVVIVIVIVIVIVTVIVIRLQLRLRFRFRFRFRLTGIGAVGVAGVNDPTCTSEHRPVVLLHGTFSTVRSNYAAMIPRLQATGRCVYGINYGLGGLQSVRSSAQEVATFIDQVLAVTGAEQVDVIAFSQGGLVLRTALRLDGAAPDVATAVLIAPTFHGTTSPLIASLPAGACAACADQAAGSSLLADLDAGSTSADGDLDGDVAYAVVGSRDDTVVTPLAAQIPQGPAERVTSIAVQDNCPDEYVDHIALPANSGVIGWAIDALQTDGRPDPTALTCS